MIQLNSPPVALITGSSKGIGRAIAMALAAKGNAVVITSRQRHHAEEVAADIQGAGGQAIGLEFDIASSAHLNRLVDQTVDYFGRLDILVNNAVSHSCLLPSDNYSDEEVCQTVTTNLTHTYLLCLKAYPRLQIGNGCILNIGSAVTRRHLLGLPLYGLIKGGMTNLTRILASEWADSGVRVNAINPGFIRTNVFSELGLDTETIEANYRLYASYQPLGGVGTPAAIADTVAYLTSPAAGFITGSIVDVDGGYTIKGLEIQP